MREVLISLVGGVMPQKAHLYDSGLIYFPDLGEWSHISKEMQQQRVIKDLVAFEKKSAAKAKKKE